MRVKHSNQRSYTPWDSIAVGDVFRSPKNTYQRVPMHFTEAGKKREAFCFETGELVRGGKGSGKGQYQVVTERAKLVICNPKKAEAQS